MLRSMNGCKKTLICLSLKNDSFYFNAVLAFDCHNQPLPAVGGCLIAVANSFRSNTVLIWKSKPTSIGVDKKSHNLESLRMHDYN